MGNLKKVIGVLAIFLALTFTTNVKHETKYFVEKDELIDWNLYEVIDVV